MKRLVTAGLLATAVLGVVPVCLGAGVPCAGTSSVWAQHYTPCVGDTVEIYGILKDCYDTPLVGKTITFYSSRGATDQIIGPSPVTDSKGFAKSKITTVVAGTCQVYFVIWGVIIGPSPAIDWSGASSVGATTWGSIKAQFKE
jgi:hypothetical protein